GAGFVVDEIHVDEQVDAAGAAQAHQVHMQRKVLDHVALHCTTDHAHVVLPLDLEVEQRGQEAPCLQLFEQVVVGETDRLRVDTAAIHNTGHHRRATSLAGGPLACPRTCLGNQIRD